MQSEFLMDPIQTMMWKRIEESDRKCLSDNQYKASIGNAEGQYNMGIRYLNGWYVERNIMEGMKLLDLAAKQHHVKACYELVKIYLFKNRYNIQSNYWAVRDYANLAKVDSTYSDLDSQKEKLVQIKGFLDLVNDLM